MKRALERGLVVPASVLLASIGIAAMSAASGCHLLVGVTDVVLDETGGAGGSGTTTTTTDTTSSTQSSSSSGMPATCMNLEKDGLETDVDCGGGACKTCADGDDCVVGTDCTSAVCGADMKCAAPTCTDAAKNGTETDVDCGGMCGDCPLGKHCDAKSDCVQPVGKCDNHVCVAGPRGKWVKTAFNVPLDDGEGYLKNFRLVYDVGAKKMIMFGGEGGTGVTAKTFVFAPASGWTVASNTTPAARTWHGMAYDATRGTIVVYGGAGGGTETWERASSTAAWSEAHPTSPVGLLNRHAMVFDVARSRTVLFGGEYSGYKAATWEYDGATWTERTLTTAPEARGSAMTVYDEDAKVVLLFGGLSEPPIVQFDDTWSWNGGNAWVKVANTGPTKRHDGMIAYDSVRKKTVLFGGIGPTLQAVNDTWEWDGTEWAQAIVKVPPPIDAEGSMAFDRDRNRIVYVREGSPNPMSTWEYQPLGIGCGVDGDCASGHCEDGLCCDNACLPNEACNTETDPGFCTIVP